MSKNEYGQKFYNSKYERYLHLEKNDTDDYGPDFLRIQGVLDSVEGNLILDAACSMGKLTTRLEKDYKVVGLDFSTNALGVARKKSTQATTFVSGDVCNLPFQSDCFDSVVAGEIIEHLDKPQKFLQECKRILKDRGVLVVTVPNGFGIWSIFFDRLIPKITGHNPEGHVNLFSFKKIRNLLSSNDFDVECVVNTGVFGIGIPLTRFRLKLLTRLDSKIAKYFPHQIALGWVIKTRKRPEADS